MLTTLRLLSAFLLMAVEVSAAIPILLVLLPWRRRRVVFSAHVAHLIGRSVTPLMGVRVRQIGGQPMAQHFPAIYLFNHSSNMDFFALLRFLPPGVCGVAKREMVLFPLIGQLYWLAGHPLLDRANPNAARNKLNSAVDFIRRERLGLFMAPEGTRSRDGLLGPFKKGFAHAALGTGLPIVPIIVHGARDRWPPNSSVIRPGEVDIEVLDPIATDAWKRDSLDQHIAAVRQVFIDRIRYQPRELGEQSSDRSPTR